MKNKSYNIIAILIIVFAFLFTLYSIQTFTIGTRYTPDKSDNTNKINETTNVRTIVDRIYKTETIFNFRTLQTTENVTISFDNSYKEITNHFVSSIDPITNNIITIDSRYKILANGVMEQEYDNSHVEHIKTLQEIKEDTISKIELINPGTDKEEIKEVLNRTNINILKYIVSIEVHNSETVTCSISDAIGCAKPIYIGDKLEKGTINIISSNYYLGNTISDKLIVNNYKKWDRYTVIPSELYDTYLNDYNNYDKLIKNRICSSFEFTLNHEIGHIYNADKYGYHETNAEINADNYANQHTIYKGEC